MARTESISIQVHPNNEQEQINLMQMFHWNLLSSQTIKTVDSHLERRGDDIYSVTNSEHYVKLAFSRSLETPNLNEIRKLEQEYFSLPHPKYPKLFPGGIIFWGIASLIYGLGIIGWLLYFFLSYKPNKEKADIDAQNITRRASEIGDAIAQFA